MRGPRQLLAAGLTGLAAQRGTLLPWAPVFLSGGIGAYFSLRVEPVLPVVIVLAVALAGLVTLAVRGREAWHLPALGLGLLIGGFLLADLRAHMVAAPVLSFRYYGPVEGRVINIDRSFSDQPRLTLDRVLLEEVPPDRTPARVRVALHEEQGSANAVPGQTVMLTAHLSPPDGPVEPGGFDFQRLAWFSSLGAVGYTRTPVMVLEEAEGGWALAAFKIRMKMSADMQAGHEGQAMAFAAAMMTGDRSAVSAATNASLRASNLSHMISISGLHMGLLCGFVFGLCRYGLALIPPLALRINSKKLAAIGALFAATFYMFIAGPDVATRRSYIMAVVILLAVLADRRAISLRSVAIAALICLVLEPESLIEPGFQMSFGATAALIVGLGYWSKVQHHFPWLLRHVAMMVLSSLLAGFATAPIAAAHFNRVAEYGLLANLLAVPICGIVVMPAGVMAAILGPFGLEAPALWALEQGCELILVISDWVAGMHGALIPVPAPPGLVLPLFGLGGAVVLIAQGWRLRGFGAVVSVLALGIWATTHRPILLVAGDGTLVGVMTEAGRALSKEKGGGFIAQSWLENDGDLALQAEGFARGAFIGKKGTLSTEVAGQPLRIFTGKGAATRAASACSNNAIVVVSEDVDDDAGNCRLYDRSRLSQSGALAFYADGGALSVVTAREVTGVRLWNRKAGHRARTYARAQD